MTEGWGEGTTTVADLGKEISVRVGRVVPHDGFILIGMDPITSVGSFGAMENGYSARTMRRMCVDFAARRIGRVRLLTQGEPADRRFAAQRRNMTDDGFGSEIFVELTHAGRIWGVVLLLRERGRTPFSTVQAGQTSELTAPIVRACKGFVAQASLCPPADPVPPSVLIVRADDTIRAATPSAAVALRESLVADEHGDKLWNNIPPLAHRVRRSGRPVVCRVLGPGGWIVMHAQPMDGELGGDVVITVQPATSEALLPVLAAWHDVTPREQTVLERLLEGMSSKEIALALGVSPHTVNDHLKAVHRKFGVSSRTELVARLCG
jgi:DNA-binding CsgD family transcriptional regulator